MARFGGFNLGSGFGSGSPSPLLGGLGLLDAPSQQASDRMYDSIYSQRLGGDSRRGGERGGQRSDQRNQRYRGGSDQRNQRHSGGSSGGRFNTAGLLGSPPVERAVSAAQGHPPGSPVQWFSHTGFGSQGSSGLMGIQQQGLAAALQAQQTQGLLAALQAQAQAQQMTNRGLLPTPPNMRMMRQGGGGGSNRQFDRNRQRQNQRQQNQQQRKRSSYQDSGSYGQAKRRRDERNDNRNKLPVHSPSRTPKATADRSDVKEKEKAELKEQKPEANKADFELTDDIEVDRELLDAVEQLRTRKKIERNVVDEDVEKLSLFSFDGQMYRCDLCKILCRQIKTLRQHLMGKRHTLNVIEARQAGNDVNRDILDIDLRNDNWLEENPYAKSVLQKQSHCLLEEKKKIEELERRQPSNFVNYRIDTRKTAIKQGGVVEITSVSEASVHIKEFTSEKHMFGCEFIKAVSGFSCRLCNMFLQSGKDVNEHIQSKAHSSGYQSFVEKNTDYEKNQLLRNKELVNRLAQYENKDVILYEVVNEEDSDLKPLGKKYIVPEDESVVRISPMMSDWHEKEETKDEEKPVVENEESQAQDGTNGVKEDEQEPMEAAESITPELEQGYQVGEDVYQGGEDDAEGNKINEQELVGFQGDDEEVEEITQYDEEENANKTEEIIGLAEDDSAEVDKTDASADKAVVLDDDEESVEPAETFKSPARGRGRGRSRGRGRGAGKRAPTRSTRASKAPAEPEPEILGPDDEESFEVIDEVGDGEGDEEPVHDA